MAVQLAEDDNEDDDDDAVDDDGHFGTTVANNH